MITTVSDSSLARAVAAQQWPDVHRQRKVAPGVYAFSCAGHGGLVAIVDKLGLDEKTLVAARQSGLIHLVARARGARTSRNYSTASGYRRSDLLALKKRYPHHVELAEVWLGEEDVEWATLAFVSKTVREGMQKSGYTSEPITQAMARTTCETYFAEFLEALES